MGNSSSQLQPSQAQPHGSVERMQTPSTTGSEVLARELEQSAYKSSRAHISRLLNSSPEVHGKYATSEERRNALAAKAAGTDAAHAKLAYERKRAKRRRLSPPDVLETVPRVTKAPAAKSTYRVVVARLPTSTSQRRPQVKAVIRSSPVVPESEENDELVNDELVEESGTGVIAEDENDLEDGDLNLEHHDGRQEEEAEGSGENWGEEEMEEEMEEEEEEGMDEDEEDGEDEEGDADEDDGDDEMRRQSVHEKGQALRAHLVNDWLQEKNLEPAHIVSGAPPRRLSGGKTKKGTLLASEPAESALHCERVPLRPVLDQHPVSHIYAGDGAAEINSNGKLNASKHKKGPYDNDEIAIMEAAFEQSRHSLDFSREQMQVEIANWGRTKPNAPYKVALKQALPDRSLDSVREFCQRHFHVSRPQKSCSGPAEALAKSSGPFSASEKEAIKRTIDETLQAQSVSQEDFLGAIYTWKGPNVEVLLAALTAALPQRSVRSLSDYMKRSYVRERKVLPNDAATDQAVQKLPTRRVSSTNVAKASVSIAEHTSDPEAESEFNTTGRRLLAVVIPVEEVSNDETTGRVACDDSTSLNGTEFSERPEGPIAYKVQNSNDAALSKDDLPANNRASSAKQYSHRKRPVLQQPTPVTSSANVSGPESEPSAEGPRDCAISPEAPHFAAEDHLDIFDLGDYYDVLKETVVVLSKNAAIANLIEDNSNLGAGNERFWQAISDATLQSKLIGIGNPAGITQIRRLAYRTAANDFQLHPATRALQCDERCHPRQKIESLLESILGGTATPAKFLPRMWRHNLIDCTREEIAWIQYSEELEKAKLYTTEYDEAFSKLGRKARKRLRRAWSRVQTEMENARELASQRYVKGVSATVATDPPTEVEPHRPSSPVLPENSQLYTSDADDGPVHFKAAGARPRRSSSTNEPISDDDIDMIPAGTRPAAGVPNGTSVGSHHPRAHQSQLSAKDIIIPDSQPVITDVAAKKSEKRPRESPASATSPDHPPLNTAAAKLKARHIAKKAKVQTTTALPSPYVHPILTKAVKQNISRTTAAQRRAYGDMSRETFLEKCRAGGS